MKITDIKQQVKRLDRYSIYVDSKYLFSLSEGEVLDSKLKIGQNLDKQQLDKLLNRADIDKAYMRALDSLSRRPRSKWEVEQYLLRRGHKNNTIQVILNKLSRKGYLDDQKFAESWVRSRRMLKTVSKRKLSFELQQKHISSSIISSALEDDETVELNVILDIIEKKRMQSRYQDDVKLKAYLVRQGFNFDDITLALKRQQV